MQPIRTSLHRGFTLIEILVVVAIIGILTAISVPSYQRYMVSGNRSAAQAHLMAWATAQSQYFADARVYATKAQLEAIAPVPAAVSAKYTVDVKLTADKQSFVLEAEANTATAQGQDGDLTLDSTGVKTPAGKW